MLDSKSIRSKLLTVGSLGTRSLKVVTLCFTGLYFDGDSLSEIKSPRKLLVRD